MTELLTYKNFLLCGATYSNGEIVLIHMTLIDQETLMHRNYFVPFRRLVTDCKHYYFGLKFFSSMFFWHALVLLVRPLKREITL